MKNIPLYKRYENKQACGVCPMSNFGGLELLDIDACAGDYGVAVACFNWGIGRELYTAPFIFMPCATDPIPQGNYTRYKMHNPYEFRGVYVSHIKTEEAPKGKLVITALELSQRDKQGNSHKIYEWGGKG